jgi:2,4-dienoyl-CoA reductase-like NADH-dependent reductase (Old Yellow Enzyme family)
VKKEVGSSMAVGIRLSQTKVNDYAYQWPGGEDDAQIIFGAVTRAGADFIHVTSKQAWPPAFEGSFHVQDWPHRYSGLPVIANGSLHDHGRAEEAIGSGSSVVSPGRAALQTQTCRESCAVPTRGSRNACESLPPPLMPVPGLEVVQGSALVSRT